MPKNYSRAFSHFTCVPWAILKSKLEEIQGFIVRKNFDIAAMEDDEPWETISAKSRPAPTTVGSIAVLPLMGVIAKRMDMMTRISGGTSIETFTQDFRDAVNNPSVKAIVLNIDSPGGSVFGVQELAAEIMDARAKKHIVAISNDMAASAAYWIAIAADEVVVTPSGIVGSIGVYNIHEDWSRAYEEAGVTNTIIQAGKFKTEGNFLQPLSEDAKLEMQRMVDFYYDAFIGAVAKGRGVSAGTVKKDFGQGRVLNSDDAKAAGMVDRVDTLDGVISRLGGSTSRSPRAKALHHTVAEKELQLLQ